MRLSSGLGIRFNNTDRVSSNATINLVDGDNVASGKINGGGDLRIAARSDMTLTSDVTISNVTVTNTNVVENPCGNNINWNNVTVSGGNYNVCN